MSWQKLPLRVIAPPEASQQRFAPEQTVWNLTLEQIEPHTGRIINKQLAPASEAGSSTYIFDTGNVLYSKLRPYLNKVIYPAEAGIATTELVPLRPQKNVVDAEYLTYYLRSNYFLKFAEQSVSGARMPRIMMTEFWKHLVPLPPLSEQRRIVEILDQADALRTKRAEADAKAERILPALFIKMFGEPATNPIGWKECSLGELIIDGPQNGLYKHSSAYGDGIPILRIDSFYDGAIDACRELRRLRLTVDEAKIYQLRENDIVINRVNSPEYLGKSALIPKLSEPTVFESNIMKFSVNTALLHPVYLIHHLQTPAIKQQIFSSAKRAINQSSINQSDVKSFKILLPSSSIQHEFAARAVTIHKITKNQANTEVILNKLFQRLLHHAFSGDLTAKWREAHMSELLVEMEQQAKIIGTTAELHYEQLPLIET